MTAITLKRFRGMVPRVSPNLLEQDQAQVARNCDLRSGIIDPWTELDKVETPTKSGPFESIYLYHHPDGSTYWLTWTQDVDVVRSPLPNDPGGRIYFTGTDAPRAADKDLITNGGTDYPNSSYLLGVPAPTNEPQLSDNDDGTGSNPEDRTYVYTFLTGWNEEGPPSPPSNVLSVNEDETVDITSMDSAPTGDYNITHRRLYRSTGGDYQFVADIPIGDASYTDSVAKADLGEVIPSEDWDPPPSDMVSLIMLPNGSLAGVTPTELCISEPYLPHAWPQEYRISFEFEPVAIGVYATTIVVATQGPPYLVSGQDPQNMSKSRVPGHQPCVSKRGLVSMRGGVIWPTPNGLFGIGPTGQSLSTDDLVTRKEWQPYRPDTIRSAWYDDRYFAFFKEGTLNGIQQGQGVIIDKGEPGSEFTELDFYATAVHVEPETETLYLAVEDDSGSAIYKWQGKTISLSAQWRSKRYVMPYPLSFSTMQVIADYGVEVAEEDQNAIINANQSVLNAGTDLEGAIGGAYIGKHEVGGDILDEVPEASGSGLQVKMYADGALKATKEFQDKEIHRLPGGFRGEEFEFEIDTYVPIREFRVATSIGELKR